MLRLTPGRPEWRWWILTIATALVRPVMRRHARKWARDPGARRVHVGCGPQRLDGWANVDFLGRQQVDIAWDARFGLPFDDATVDVIYLENVIAYLRYDHAERFVYESARVLRPGGVIRIASPDMRRYMASYVGDRVFIDESRPDRFSPLVAVMEAANGHGHRSAWDAETTLKLLAAAGLDARERGYRESAIDDCPDSPGSRENFYVEARRPTGHAA
jgi:predicted SAM-dependent methyltransferase